MKVLITGSSGFIGTALVNYLVSKGHVVLGIDVKVPKPETADHEFLECNILDAERIEQAFQDFRPHGIVHLAAHMSLRESVDADERYRANTEGTRNLMTSASKCAETKRAIYTSTKYVYRDGEPSGTRDYAPDSSYGRSKVQMEEMIWDLDGGGLDWCITRPTTIWGAGMSKHYQRFLRMVEEGKYVHIGSSPVKKSMGYVGNIAAQYERLLTVKSSKMHQKVLYVTDYEPEILREWVEGFAKILGGKKIRTIPLVFASVCGRIGDTIKAMGWRKFPFTSFRVKNLTESEVVDASETEAICGESPYSREEALEATTKWFKSL